MPHDVPALASLYAHCARTMGPRVYTPEQVRAWVSFGADTPAFRDYVLTARTWIACGDDGAPVAMAGIDDAGEVHSLYVHPQCMRAGLGSRLLAHALADMRARGVDRFAAWATPFSRPVFERAGFVLEAVVREPFAGVLFDRLRLRLEPRADMAAGPPDRPMFETEHLLLRELGERDLPALQALMDANPEYFRTVNGRDALPDEARQEFVELPPPHLSWTRRWFAGLYRRADADLVGAAVVVSDLGAPGAWHVAWLWLASALHGRGLGREAYLGLESWAAHRGARWMRLGVVAGNAKAERFWAGLGFTEVRQRRGMDTGGRVNDLRVMVKPLGRDGLEAYLAAAPRDRPDSALP